MDSLLYYNKNPQGFFDRTIHADLDTVYQKFLPLIPKNGRILDAGCGSGRDTKFFRSQGYEVVPFDGSIEMVKMASDLLQQPVSHLYFQDIDFSDEFDAVWANASLLHVPYANQKEILQRLHRSLRPDGILLASFKYGTDQRQTEDRFFFDMTEESIFPYLEGLFEPIEIWKRPDTRFDTPSPRKHWLFCLARWIP